MAVKAFSAHYFLRQFRNSRRNGPLRHIIPHRDDQPPPYSNCQISGEGGAEIATPVEEEDGGGAQGERGGGSRHKRPWGLTLARFCRMSRPALGPSPRQPALVGAGLGRGGGDRRQAPPAQTRRTRRCQRGDAAADLRRGAAHLSGSRKTRLFPRFPYFHGSHRFRLPTLQCRCTSPCLKRRG